MQNNKYLADKVRKLKSLTVVLQRKNAELFEQNIYLKDSINLKSLSALRRSNDQMSKRNAVLSAMVKDAGIANIDKTERSLSISKAHNARLKSENTMLLRNNTMIVNDCASAATNGEIKRQLLKIQIPENIAFRLKKLGVL